MSRSARNAMAVLPVARRTPSPRRGVTGFCMTPDHAPITLSTRVRKGVVRGHHSVGVWDTTSPFYANSVTIDSRWSKTVSTVDA